MTTLGAPALLPDEPAAFGALLEPHRAELVVHCYRMLGSLDDAEDAVQDAFVRAWNGRATFTRSGSVRAWLYRIATTASLDAIGRRRRRRETSLDVEPAPDAWLAGATVGPEARYELRETISLAFLRALQVLPPRQRATLILRDVLGWGIDEIADLLETSVPGVNSALQRARATVDGRATAPTTTPSSSVDRPVADRLERFVRAWEAADVEGLARLLRADALLRMPPRPDVLGAAAIAAFVRDHILVPGGPNRLVAVRANGATGFLVVGPATPGGAARPFAILVPEPDDVVGGFGSIVASARPTTVERFAAAS